MEWINNKERSPVSDKDEPCNEYYLIQIEGYGWGKAMFIEGIWYANYWTQVYKPVTHWMRIEEPKY